MSGKQELVFDPSWLGDYRFDIKIRLGHRRRFYRIWRFQRYAQVGKKNANTTTEH